MTYLKCKISFLISLVLVFCGSSATAQEKKQNSTNQSFITGKSETEKMYLRQLSCRRYLELLDNEKDLNKIQKSELEILDAMVKRASEAPIEYCLTFAQSDEFLREVEK